MRLLNPFFSRSKREQDKPIRDKLKDKKYFEKMLSIKLGEIADDEKYIQKERNSNDGIVRPFLYWCSAVDHIRAIEINYSMGEDIGQLRKLYTRSLDNYILGANFRNPTYADDLDRISLGILLDIDNTAFNRLADYVLQMDGQAKSVDWTPNQLLWFLLNARLGDDKKQTYADKLAFPKLYKGLFKLTKIIDTQEAKKALEDYIGKWYNLNKDAPWHDNHLMKYCYRGYWAWEVAAVAKIMHIDDSDLKDNPFYPYDMVHWKDNVTTEGHQHNSYSR